MHGPLELLFTVSEEQGLDGAKALDPALVSGRLLLNLDGTSDSSLTIGCAGSTHAFTRLRLPREPVPDGWTMLQVAVSGARGGHSGGDIAKGRVNAIKALGRLLVGTPLRLARLEGGVSRNALPREARAIVAVREPAAFAEAAERKLAAIREQFAGTDDALALSIEPVERQDAADEAASARALDLLAATPSGVVAMSAALPDKVETSTSLNVATTEDGVLTLASMTRSANAHVARRRRRVDRGRRTSRRRRRASSSPPTRPGVPTSTPSCSRPRARRSSASSGSTRRSRSSTAASSARSSETSSQASR